MLYALRKLMKYMTVIQNRECLIGGYIELISIHNLA